MKDLNEYRAFIRAGLARTGEGRKEKPASPRQAPGNVGTIATMPESGILTPDPYPDPFSRIAGLFSRFASWTQGTQDEKVRRLSDMAEKAGWFVLPVFLRRTGGGILSLDTCPYGGDPELAGFIYAPMESLALAFGAEGFGPAERSRAAAAFAKECADYAAWLNGMPPAEPEGPPPALPSPEEPMPEDVVEALLARGL